MYINEQAVQRSNLIISKVLLGVEHFTTIHANEHQTHHKEHEMLIIINTNLSCLHQEIHTISHIKSTTVVGAQRTMLIRVKLPKTKYAILVAKQDNLVKCQSKH